MQTVTEISRIETKTERPPRQKFSLLRGMLEFAMFLTMGLLLLEPVLTFAGISNRVSSEGKSYSIVKGTVSREAINFASHIPSVILSKDNPDVVVIGSSLIVWPAVACDGFGVPFTEGFKSFPGWFRYQHARYFEQCLQSSFSKKLSVVNMAVAGASMSDDNLMFRKYLEAGKRPKLAICCLHPSQFMCSDLPFPDYSSLSLELRGLQSTDRRRVTSLEILRDRLFISLRKLHKRNGCQPGGGGMQSQTRWWSAVYNPCDPAAFSRSCQTLEEMARTAQRYAIPLLVVDMPIPGQHRAVIDKQLLAEYRRRVVQISRSCGVKYCDLDTSVNFRSEADFADFAHLNTSGGRKFYLKLIEILGSDHHLSDYLGAGS